jgi:hypothetical protein
MCGNASSSGVVGSLARCGGLLVVISILLVGPAGRAGADSISYSTYANSRTNTGLLPQFDPNLGTLIRVDFSASGNDAGDVSVTSTNTGAAGTFSGSIAFEIEGGGDLGATSVSGSFSILPFQESIDLDPNFSVSDSFTNGLGVFEGLNSLNMLITASLGASEGFVHDPIAFAEMSVTYIYESAGSVPEPPSLVLGTISLVGMAWYVRRR